MIRSRRMRWAGHVARISEMRHAYKMVGNPEGKRAFVRPRRRWKDQLKWLLGKCGLSVGLDASGLEQGPVAGCCEHGDEPSGSIKGGAFLD
jgi:hypothetical protein